VGGRPGGGVPRWVLAQGAAQPANPLLGVVRHDQWVGAIPRTWSVFMRRGGALVDILALGLPSIFRATWLLPLPVRFTGVPLRSSRKTVVRGPLARKKASRDQLEARRARV